MDNTDRKKFKLYNTGQQGLMCYDYYFNKLCNSDFDKMTSFCSGN